MRERIYWWWQGLVEWLLDRPYAWREWWRRSAERTRLACWDLGDRIFDLLDALRARLRSLVTVRRPLLALAAAGGGGGAGESREAPSDDRLRERQSELARREQQLETRRAELRALEETLTQRLRSLREREEEVAERLAQLEERLDARCAEVEQREQRAAEREGALDALESETALTRAARADSPTEQRELDWWQKQLGSAAAEGSTNANRARRRFDPATASALRRSRHERRLRD